MQWIHDDVKTIQTEWTQKAQTHQDQLTKPQGSLGKLEDIAIQFCAWQQTCSPQLKHIAVRVFAADHGIAAQNVSAFPQEVTAQMIANFIHGGAAISVLSHALNADFNVVNLGTVGILDKDIQNASRLINTPIAASTADFSCREAMTEAQLHTAFDAGKNQIDALDTDLFIGGEMGIANTSSASAIYAELLNLDAVTVCGPGTGLDDAGIAHKQSIITQALTLHKHAFSSPIAILRCVGGFEIAALCASYLRCAQKGIPILVDGFICTAAALAAIRINSDVQKWMLFSHQSAEPAHSHALNAIDASPLLNLGMRLGEGSGAAVAVPLIQNALTLHNGMASFETAHVSKQ